MEFILGVFVGVTLAIILRINSIQDAYRLGVRDGEHLERVRRELDTDADDTSLMAGI